MLHRPDPLKPLKRIVKLIPGSVWFYRKIRGTGKVQPLPRYLLERGKPPSPDLEALKQNYSQSALASRPDTFVLYRIIGNDLVPRHRKGQSRENLRFILENEPAFPNCEKRFVVNRITDPAEEKAIIDMLETSGFGYLHIGFHPEDYRRIPWDISGAFGAYAPYTEKFASLEPPFQQRLLMRLYRHKNNYVMNNNGARNAALADGKQRAKWVLPFDGNCFITSTAWHEIVRGVKDSPHFPYFTVPMARITNNALALDDTFHPDATEEPQVLFRRDASLAFNERYFYGRRPKVELLWRLGVPGVWDRWMLEPWDLPGPAYAPEAGCFGYAGWVFRLDSGNAKLEDATQNGLIDRGLARNQAIAEMLDRLDCQARAAIDLSSPLIVAASSASALNTLSGKVENALLQAAEEALTRGPFSVVHKTAAPPSGDPHDYYHPAPYYWPNPLKPSGRPYIHKDGQRVPGTRLYEPQSDQYDRTRLQRLFDDTFVLSLAGSIFRDNRYLEHAAGLVRTWFLIPETAMNPHLAYAQVRPGHNNDQGSNSGIIEMKDLYYFIDALRMLIREDCFSSAEYAGLQNWFEKYLHWLRTSAQGRKERSTANNHGVYYDLQAASIAAFLDDKLLVRDILRDSRFRILEHFEADGRQPHEMKRTTTAHYCCFNLQGWIHLAMIAESCGENLWEFEGTDGRGIRMGMQWLLSHMGRPWPYPQINEFDPERFYPIYHEYTSRYGQALPPPVTDRLAAPVPDPADIKPLFYPHDGIRPFWQINASDGPAASCDKNVLKASVKAL